jgi:hypothetical protein
MTEPSYEEEWVSDLEEMIEQLLMESKAEWHFLMGAELKTEKSEHVPDAPRVIYYASMSTHISYATGKPSAYVKPSAGYLHIISAERHYNFPDAIRDLTQQYHKFMRKSSDET